MRFEQDSEEGLSDDRKMDRFVPQGRLERGLISTRSQVGKSVEKDIPLLVFSSHSVLLIVVKDYCIEC